MMAGQWKDEDLVAYLDGEADAVERAKIEALVASDSGAAARLDLLSRGSLPFRAAFEVRLKEAPVERLQAMLDDLPRRSAPAPIQPAGGWRRRDVLVGGMLLFLAGGLSGRFLSGQPDQAPDSDADADAEPDAGWRQAVAEYLTLYTRETLADLATDPATLARQFALVGDKITLPLSAESLRIPAASLKRAQLFSYDGEPLAQVAYLDAEDRPLALCIVAKAGGAAAPATEKRLGMNVAFWATASHRFMLIGHAPEAAMAAMAGDLRSRLGA